METLYIMDNGTNVTYIALNVMRSIGPHTKKVVMAKKFEFRRQRGFQREIQLRKLGIGLMRSL